MIELRRIDPARHMSRFYRLDVQLDFFTRVLLVRQWSRIGAQERVVDESFATEPLAADAMRKQRRGYV